MIRYPRLSLEKYNKKPKLFIFYVDKYYIKNKWITFSAVTSYFIYVMFIWVMKC